MDFDESGVRLLGYTQFQTDASYTPRCYNSPQCMDTGVSVTPARTGAASLPISGSMGAARMIAATSPTPAAYGAPTMYGVGAAGGEQPAHPPPYGYSAAEPPVTSQYDSYYSPGQAAPSCMQGPYTPSQAGSPAMSITTTPGADLDDLDNIPIDALLLTGADPGPHDQPVPIIEPMLPEEPPSKIKKESPFPRIPRNVQHNKWSQGTGGGTMPHSHSDVKHLQQPKRGRALSKYASRHFTRAKSPMFPDQSTPLSSVSLSRQPSISSISSSTKSDPFSAPSIANSVRSDPGVYRHDIHHSDSPFHSPTSLQDSPKFIFAGTSATSSPASQSELPSRSCLELEMPTKYSRKIIDIDKKILELQAKRSKLLEKVHRDSGTGPIPHVGRGDIDSHWLTSTTEKSTDIGKVLLYIFPLGIREFDEPVYEEANAILRKVGGMYFDLQRALTSLRDICCKGSIIIPEISTCFAYIHSLLNINQRLKLAELTCGIYRIQLDLESGTSDGPVPHEFYVALTAANDVLMSAQHITQSYSNMQINLQRARQRASEKIANFEKICNKLEIVPGERKNHIKSVLEGYSIAIASAERVWPQYYQVATDTISTITECIHPSGTCT